VQVAGNCDHGSASPREMRALRFPSR
jgi:hypothetical protein